MSQAQPERPTQNLIATTEQSVIVQSPLPKHNGSPPRHYVSLRLLKQYRHGTCGSHRELRQDRWACPPPQGGATSGVFKTLPVTDPSACSELVDGVNFSLNDVDSIGGIFDATECCSKCKTFANAKVFTHAGTSYCKSKKGTSEYQGGATSGVIA
ncbi:unnamed protein product [Aphanomyces euteiches]